MSISIFKRSRGGTEQLDIQEAYNIWNWLRSGYSSLETLQLYENLVHDRDFSLLLGRLQQEARNIVKSMEQEAEKFKIPVPNRPPLDVKFSASINQLTDKMIYRKIFADMVAQVFFVGRAVRLSTTNDRLRTLFMDDFLAHARTFELFYKYGKAKGWEEEPPKYKMATPVLKESLSLAEAFHLWDHLSQRYDHLQKTTLYLGIAHDPDFKLILSHGVTLLNGQIKKLEQEVLKYGVTLPDRPPTSIEVAIDPEILKDRYLYTDIFTGIVEAIDLHLRAVIESIINDRLRDMYLEILKDEAGVFDNFLKYGKTKGWTKIPPIYGESLGS